MPPVLRLYEDVLSSDAVEVGLPSLPCPGVLALFDEGEVAEVDWTAGAVRNVTSGATTQGAPIPPALQRLVAVGGVEAVLRAEGYLAAR